MYMIYSQDNRPVELALVTKSLLLLALIWSCQEDHVDAHKNDSLCFRNRVAYGDVYIHNWWWCSGGSIHFLYDDDWLVLKTLHCAIFLRELGSFYNVRVYNTLCTCKHESLSVSNFVQTLQGNRSKHLWIRKNRTGSDSQPGRDLFPHLWEEK